MGGPSQAVIDMQVETINETIDQLLLVRHQFALGQPLSKDTRKTAQDSILSTLLLVHCR